MQKTIIKFREWYHIIYKDQDGNARHVMAHMPYDGAKMLEWDDCRCIPFDGVNPKGFWDDTYTGDQVIAVLTDEEFCKKLEELF